LSPSCIVLFFDRFGSFHGTLVFNGSFIVFTFFSTYSFFELKTWGFHKGQDVENVHTNFCKRILGVKKSTYNNAVYYELGRFPLEIDKKRKIFKYWLKIRKSNNCILRTCYQEMQ
jgi:hypothetical protein